LQWLKNPGQINEGNLNSVRRNTSRTFTNKKRDYLKEENNEFGTKNKKKKSETEMRTPEPLITESLKLLLKT